MKICAVCDLSLKELRKSGERLVECTSCGESVCTASCAETVETEEGEERSICGECVRRVARQEMFTAR